MDIKLRGWNHREDNDEYMLDLTDRLEIILTLKDLNDGTPSYAL